MGEVQFLKQGIGIFNHGEGGKVTILDGEFLDSRVEGIRTVDPIEWGLVN